MRSFRIIRNEYWNEYGQLAKTHWTVQKRCKLLFWYYWHTIHDQAYSDYSSPITFESYADAFKFIKEVLFLGKPYSQFTKTIEEELTISPLR
jgi:hypothetical protein